MAYLMGVDIYDPVGAPTAVAGLSSGDLVGQYRYAVTYVSHYGETMIGPLSNIVTATNGSVNLSNIALGEDNNVIKRGIYRTLTGAVGDLYLVTYIEDNITTTYVDLLADAELGAISPESSLASTVGTIEGSVKFTKQLLLSQQTVSALGIDRLTAAPITAEFVFADVPVAGAGVRLPPLNANLVGMKVTVNNTDPVNNLLIYPRLGTDTINGGPGGSPYSLASGFAVQLISRSSADWIFASSLTAGVAGPPSGAAGGDLTGSYPTPSLVATGVSAGSYGSATQSAVLSVDAKGRVLTASSVPINVTAAGPAGGDLTGTYPNPTLAATGVAPNTYGTGTQIPVITVDGKGRLTNVTTTPLVVTTSGAAGGDLTGTYPNPTLVTSGVIPGIYGSTSVVPQINVDAKGRILGVASIPLTSVPGGAAGGDLAGVYPNPTLAATGVASGSYGAPTDVPVITVDSKGRIVTITTVGVAGGAPTGAAGGSLLGTYPNPSLSATGVAPGQYSKVDVNLEGRVTVGGYLAASDLPAPSGDVTGVYTNLAVTSIGGVATNVSGTRLIISGSTLATGASNTVIGVGAGAALTTETGNTIIGAAAAPALTGSNNLILGAGAVPSSNTVSNEVTIGNSTQPRVRFGGAIPVYADNAAALGGGLTVGCIYRNSTVPDVLCIVH
jgi:hypothetical protein